MCMCARVGARARAHGDRQHYTVMLPSGLDVHTAMVVLDREVAPRSRPRCILLQAPSSTPVVPPLPCVLWSLCVCVCVCVCYLARAGAVGSSRLRGKRSMACLSRGGLGSGQSTTNHRVNRTNTSSPNALTSSRSSSNVEARASRCFVLTGHAHARHS